jgi:hypothetical protein
MKSFALLLGAAVSLASLSAFAEKNPYEKNAEAQLPDQRVDNRYWEKRSTGALDEKAPPSEVITPGARTEDALNKLAEKSGDRDHTLDRKDVLRADRDEKRLGIGVEAGGGFGGFLDKNISEQTGVQGQWTARLIFGTRSHFGAEAAYIGSAQSVNTSGISQNAKIVGNGAETAFRYNLFTGMFQPYASAGIGWVHYSLGNAQLTTSDVQQNGDVAVFPVGLGMTFKYMGFMLDNRFSLHPATSSGLIRNTNLSTWDIQARGGFEF